MPGVTDINTTKSRLHKLLQKATPITEEPPKKTSKIIPTLLIICLLGTMIPFEMAMTFFSLSFVTIALLSLILIWKNQLRISKYMVALAVALTATSVLSGCSPGFTFQTPPELLKIAHENDYQVYTLRKVGIFGLGLDQATVETTQAQSDIKTVHAVQIDKGHGLVSIITITIAGKA